jgi:hypothetical protein
VDFVPLPGAWRIEFGPDGEALFAHGISNAWRLPLQVKDRQFFHEMGLGEPQVAQISNLLYRRFPIGNALGEAKASTSSIIPVSLTPSAQKASQEEGPDELPKRITAFHARLRAEIVLASRIRLTDTRTRELLADLAPLHGGKLERVFLSRDGQRVMAVAEDGLIHFWDLPRLRVELAKLNLDWGEASAPAPMKARPFTVSSPAKPLPSTRPVRRVTSLNPSARPRAIRWPRPTRLT